MGSNPTVSAEPMGHRNGALAESGRSRLIRNQEGPFRVSGVQIPRAPPTFRFCEFTLSYAAASFGGSLAGRAPDSESGGRTFDPCPPSQFPEAMNRGFKKWVNRHASP